MKDHIKRSERLTKEIVNAYDERGSTAMHVCAVTTDPWPDPRKVESRQTQRHREIWKFVLKTQSGALHVYAFADIYYI